MERFVGYCTDTNEDVIVLSLKEYREDGLPDDWQEYVWINAESKQEAYLRYDDCMYEYEQDVKQGRPAKTAY